MIIEEAQQIDRNKEHINRANRLKQELSSGAITLAEFEVEHAYWFLSILDKVYVHVIPPKPPNITSFENKLSNIKMAANKAGKDFDEELFWKANATKGIDDYYYYTNKVKRRNRDNYFWILQFKKILPIEDTENHHRLDMLIDQFEEMGYNKENMNG